MQTPVQMVLVGWLSWAALLQVMIQLGRCTPCGLPPTVCSIPALPAALWLSQDASVTCLRVEGRFRRTEGLASFLEPKFIFKCRNSGVFLKCVLSLLKPLSILLRDLSISGWKGVAQENGSIRVKSSYVNSSLEHYKQKGDGGFVARQEVLPAGKPFLQYKQTSFPSRLVRFYQIFSYFLFIFKHHINSRYTIFSCLNLFLTDLLNAIQFLNQLPYPECLPNLFH